MLLVRDAFKLPHPDRNRFDKVMNSYFETFESLSTSVSGQPASTEQDALKAAASRAAEQFTAARAVELEARKYKLAEPERAEEIYRRGIKKFGDSAPLLGSYANFLTDVLKEHDRAEENYQRALESDPAHAINLGNYANFLSQIATALTR